MMFKAYIFILEKLYSHMNDTIFILEQVYPNIQVRLRCVR